MNKDIPQSNTDWQRIKEKYSQSGWFDNIHDIKELDADISQLLEAEKKRVLEMVIKKGKAYMVPSGAGSQSEGEWSIGFKQGIHEMMMWANETIEKMKP